jgi:hypothetical protein
MMRVSNPQSVWGDDLLRKEEREVEKGRKGGRRRKEGREEGKGRVRVRARVNKGKGKGK